MAFTAGSISTAPGHRAPILRPTGLLDLAGAHPTILELVALSGLMLLALLLRAQHLSDIPRYADEINEILPTTDVILPGHGFPLVSGPKHIGALFNYLLAAAMLLFGKSPDLPRQLVLAAGLATVLLTYAYARMLGGRAAGLLAAALLAVSAPHVLLSSRLAWSASLTPLLFTGAAWALERAVALRQPRWVLLCGLLAGLALQAHPSVAALLPGLGLFLLLRGRSLLRRPASYAAIPLFVAGFANVLLYNWQSGIGALRSIHRQYPHEATGLAAYPTNLAALLRGLGLTLASAIDPTRETAVTEPFVLLVGAVSLLGLVCLARRASPLPLLVTLSSLALMPLSRDSFAPLLEARYIMPLVPLVYVGVGVLGVQLLAAQPENRWIAVRQVGAAAVAFIMLSGMVASLLQFEATVQENDCTNAPQRAIVAEIERQRLPGEWVLLDEGSVRPAARLGYLTLLELSGQKVGETVLGRGGLLRELAERPTFLTVVDDGKAAGVFRRQGLALLPQTLLPLHPALVEPGSDGRKDDGGIGLYRVSPQGAALLAYNPQPGCGGLRLN